MSRGSKSKAWHASLTPAQKAEWKRKLVEGHKRARESGKMGRPKKTDYTLSVSCNTRIRGRYAIGTSRTLIFRGISWTPDETLERIEKMVKKIHGLTTKGHPARVVDLSINHEDN